MKITTLSAMVLFVGTLFGQSVPVHAQKWADLTMTVLLDGDAPKPKTLNMAADPKCGDNKLSSDDLIVDPNTKAIANMVFMVDFKKSKLKPDQIHPDLKEVPAVKPVLDNIQCKFVPHLLAVRAGQAINVKNSDPTGHNAKFNFFSNDEVNPLIPSGGSKEVFTKVEERAPTKVDCNIHPWMNAYILVTEHPYVGISDTAGVIKISKLPAGVPLEFKLWHESQNKLEAVNLGGKNENWPRGFVTMTLKEGANDLGKLLIKPDKFKEK